MSAPKTTSLLADEDDNDDGEERERVNKIYEHRAISRAREDEFNRAKNQVYNENNIFNDNRIRQDNFALKVRPPQPDYNVGDSGPYGMGMGTGRRSFGDDGAQSMQYNAFFGNPTTIHLEEQDLQRKYNGNLTYFPNGSLTSPSNSSSGINKGGVNPDPLWDDSSITDDITLSSTKRRDDGSYREGIVPGGTTSGNKKGKESAGIDQSGLFNTRDEISDVDYRRANQWMYEKDPFGSGKSFLLRELKRKFLEMTSPIVDFVSIYLAMTGHTSENAIYDKIKILSEVERANPLEPSDFDALVNHLYSEDSDIASALIGHLVTYTAIKKEKEAMRRQYNVYQSADAGSTEAKEAKETILELRKDIAAKEEVLDEDDNFKEIARKLKSKYEYVANGKIVFVLNNIFRNEAQMVLDEINGFCHGKKTNRYFTLLEIMNSSFVRAKFIRMMIITKTSINVGGVTPITMNNLGSQGGGVGGGTIADRMNNGSYRGNGDMNKTIVIQSRPTQANLVVGSIEYMEGLNIFKTVIKSRDGSNSLVSNTNGHSLNQNRLSNTSSFYDSNGKIIPKYMSSVYDDYHINNSRGPYSYNSSRPNPNKRSLGKMKGASVAVEEIRNNIYYDEMSNTYKLWQDSADKMSPSERGFVGTYEDSVVYFLKKQERKNRNEMKKNKKRIIVQSEDGQLRSASKH